MNGPFSWIIRVSARHIRSRRESDRNTASRLSIVGIAVGVMALVVVLSVMNGFQLDTIEAMLEVNSYHLRIDGESAANANDEVISGIASVPGVRAVVPFNETEAIVRGFFDTSRGAVLRAVPGDVLERDPGLAENLELVEGKFDFTSAGVVMLGVQLRRQLGVRIGDTLTIVTLGGGSQGGRVPREANLEVIGTFRTGSLEYDGGWAFVSERTASRTFGTVRSDRTIGIKLVDRFTDIGTAARIVGLDGIEGQDVSSWREYNRAIFGALRTEKATMTLLLGLIFVVVAANIYQSLRRSVHDRAEEIAILKALGARPRDIQMIFVVEGIVIGLSGAIAGLTLGLLVAANVNALFALAEQFTLLIFAGVETLAAPLVGAIPGPQLFYMTEVPVAIVFGEVLGIVTFAVLSAVVAAWCASRRAAGVRPAEVLRNE